MHLQHHVLPNKDEQDRLVKLLDSRATYDKYGYIYGNDRYLAMNYEEDRQYRFWLTHADFSLYGNRDTYKTKASMESKEAESFRHEQASRHANWFLLKCIVRRISETAGTDDDEVWTWLPTAGGGWHVVISSKGRVFHVIANKSLMFKKNGKTTGREVCEVKPRGEAMSVRVFNCFKKGLVHKSKVFLGNGKVKERVGYYVNVSVLDALKECFGPTMLVSSGMDREFFRRVMKRRTNVGGAQHKRKSVLLKNLKNGEVIECESLKKLAAALHIPYSTLKSKIAKMKKEKRKTITVRGVEMGILVKPSDLEVCVRKKRVARVKPKAKRMVVTDKRLDRIVRKAVCGNKDYKGILERSNRRVRYFGCIGLVELYERELEKALENGLNDLCEAYFKPLVVAASDCGFSSERACAAAKMLNADVREAFWQDRREKRNKRLRKFFGGLSWEAKKRRFKEDRNGEYTAWKRKKGIFVPERVEDDDWTSGKDKG